MAHSAIQFNDLPLKDGDVNWSYPQIWLRHFWGISPWLRGWVSRFAWHFFVRSTMVHQGMACRNSCVNDKPTPKRWFCIGEMMIHQHSPIICWEDCLFSDKAKFEFIGIYIFPFGKNDDKPWFVGDFSPKNGVANRGLIHQFRWALLGTCFVPSSPSLHDYIVAAWGILGYPGALEIPGSSCPGWLWFRCCFSGFSPHWWWKRYEKDTNRSHIEKP